MRRRVMGRETEYGYASRHGGKPDRRFPLRYLLPSHPTYQMLRNAARFYIDIGDHPEYSTPECDSPEDVRDCAEAGHRKVAFFRNAALKKVNKKLRPEEMWELDLFANNIANYGSEFGEDTFGTHYNFQTEYPASATTADYKEFMEPFVAFMATMQIVLGAGRLRFDCHGQPYHELAQRSGFVHSVYSDDTTKNRPLINLRNEPHAGPHYGRRIHLITFDTPIFPQTTWRTAGLLDVLLTMHEEKVLKGLSLQNPVRVVQEGSRYPASKFPLVGRRGYYTLAEVQHHYVEQALDFLADNPDLCRKRPAVEDYAGRVELLRQTLDPEAHNGQLEWATKRLILDKLWRRGTYTPLTLQGQELGMHRITGDNKLRQYLLKKYGQWNEAAVQGFMRQPPATTRANARWELLQRPDFIRAGWDYARVKPFWELDLADPLDPKVPPEEHWVDFR
jgi:proteasome accessory factor A